MDHARHLSAPSPTSSPFFDDGMHQMLSANSSSSSTSSTPTMPLLAESHSHHSFSRISLEEYSPLNLVEDCDNSNLPISPTSLACGSHHSFKGSLNGLKLDNLSSMVVGDVDHHSHSHHHAHSQHPHHQGHGGSHEDVNDTHSMSPSLNLWSSSSTAITQNTSLLNSHNSTSFLLSHHHNHHHQQLNSLIQQLEPQSLDEPFGGQSGAPATNAGSSFASHQTHFDPNLLSSHRPSSEPPPGVLLVDSLEADSKSLNLLPTQASSATSASSAASATSAPTKAKGVRATKSSSSAAQDLSAAPARSRRSRSKAAPSAAKRPTQADSDTQQPLVHCSKVHLQLNYHKKLQELQQRLFGPTETSAPAAKRQPTSGESDAIREDATVDQARAAAADPEPAQQPPAREVKQEPDSSGNGAGEKPTQTRPTRLRRSRAKANRTPPTTSSSGTQTVSQKQQIVVKTETAEPDTTTKMHADCIKLADLLANGEQARVDSEANEDKATKSLTSPLSSSAAANSNNNADDSIEPAERMRQQQQVAFAGSTIDKQQQPKLQQIQLQVSPSSPLTLVAAAKGNPMQQNGAAAGGQLLFKPTAQNNGLLKASNVGGESVPQLELSDASAASAPLWPADANGNTNGGAAPINQHQIAIQVICQDGTLLVLPVSSAAGLNAAVSLGAHPQLQAVLANGVAATQGAAPVQLRAAAGAGAQLPPLSVANIVANQQQQATGGVFQPQTSSSGLAASSPTLAALLDAGSSRLTNGDAGGQGGALVVGQGGAFVSSSSLLKRLVGSAANVGALACGSLISVGETNGTGAGRGALNFKTSAAQGASLNGKRIKLEPIDFNYNNSAGSVSPAANPQAATLTLIDAQGLIVANGNQQQHELKPAAKQQQTGAQAAKTNGAGGAPPGNNNSAAEASQPPAGAKSAAHTAKGAAPSTTNAAARPSKMGPSTGNRQVDPAQPFRCEHCNSTFTRLGNFTRHKKIHTVPTKDGQRFKCDVCSKSFLQRCDLARHLHIHRGTEPHRCNICGKGYIRHSDLVTHQRFHNKEKPFGCPHCSKGFCQRGDLNRHLRSIHLQMKPILCPCCNRKFAKQETLLRHLNSAHRSKAGGCPATNSSAAAPSSSAAPADPQLANGANSVVNNACAAGSPAGELGTQDSEPSVAAVEPEANGGDRKSGGQLRASRVVAIKAESASGAEPAAAVASDEESVI